MPLLNDHALAELRRKQEGAARENKLCDGCTGQIWPNYCRQCDEHFMDGHYAGCAHYTEHQMHRRY